MENNNHTKVREHISSILQAKKDMKPFSDSELLITDGRMDSVDVVNTVLFLENEFGLDFSGIGFDRNFFDSVNAIMELIKNNT